MRNWHPNVENVGLFSAVPPGQRKHLSFRVRKAFLMVTILSCTHALDSSIAVFLQCFDSPTSRQKRLIRSTSAMELAGEYTSRGSPTTIASVVARDSATLIRFLSRRKLSPRGPASPKLEHIEMMTTAACWTWNLSTAPMRACAGSAACNLLTCML